MPVSDGALPRLSRHVFDDKGSTGFIASFTPEPIMVTELAAEHLIRLILTGLVQVFKLKTGELTIVNHLGEILSDVEFMPPTFQGGEADIILFVTLQSSLLKAFSIYDESGILDCNTIELAAQEGILDDFLSLVQIRAKGVSFAVKKPSH